MYSKLFFVSSKIVVPVFSFIEFSITLCFIAFSVETLLCIMYKCYKSVNNITPLLRTNLFENMISILFFLAGLPNCIYLNLKTILLEICRGELRVYRL